MTEPVCESVREPVCEPACSPPVAGALPGSPEVVIDTQSVLDWLYFNDPGCASWEPMRQAGAWQAIATAEMRAELAHVLGRMFLPGCTAERGAQVLADFDARIRLVATPEPGSLPDAPRCRDRDDQKFIELALARRVRWLVSRDKMVLKLRNRLRGLAGVEILAGAAWNAALLAAVAGGAQAPAAIASR